MRPQRTQPAACPASPALSGSGRRSRRRVTAVTCAVFLLGALSPLAVWGPAQSSPRVRPGLDAGLSGTGITKGSRLGLRAASTPRWGPPEVIARHQSEVDGGSSGHVAMHRRWVLGSWETARGIRYALRDPASGWSVQDSVPDAWLGPVAMGPHGAALMTWVGPRNAVSNGRGSWFETHREDGQWSTPAVLVNVGLDASTAAITPDGSMTVAWSDRDGVHVMTRSAGGEWGEPQTLDGFGYNMEIATNHNGDMLLAWASDYNRARTAYRPAGGEWTVGPELRSPIFLYSIAVALNDNGQALLLWGRDTEEEYYVKRYLAWSMRSPDGTWSETGYLDSRARANALGTNTLDVALNSHGRGLAVWDAEENGPTASHVARFNPIRGWTTPKSLDKAGLGEALLTETGDAVAALAVSPSGRRQFWWHQTAGERWRRHELDTRGVSSYGYGVSLDSAGQRMVMLSVNGTVVSRRLRVPLR